MDAKVLTPRKTISIRFSRELEFRLLSTPLPHVSLSDDLEQCANKGLELLDELKDVREIKHQEQIKKLINESNTHHNMGSLPFKAWNISISEELLDEVELLILTHGEDLKNLGLRGVSVSSVIVLLIVTGLYHPDFRDY